MNDIDGFELLTNRNQHSTKESRIVKLKFSKILNTPGSTIHFIISEKILREIGITDATNSYLNVYISRNNADIYMLTKGTPEVGRKIGKSGNYFILKARVDVAPRDKILQTLNAYEFVLNDKKQLIIDISKRVSSFINSHLKLQQ